jgi:membrane protein implicated in regulation of membrane protease activity
MCHLVLALPVLALPVFWIWPLSIALPVYGLVAGASLVLYGHIWKAIKRPRMNGAEGMLGSEGTVVSTNERGLSLLLHGELWSARAKGESLVTGDKARIVGVDGLTLRVKRCAGS